MVETSVPAVKIEEKERMSCLVDQNVAVLLLEAITQSHSIEYMKPGICFCAKESTQLCGLQLILYFRCLHVTILPKVGFSLAFAQKRQIYIEVSKPDRLSGYLFLVSFAR